MASEGVPVQRTSPAPAAVAPAPPKISDPPQPIHNVLNTCQTDSESVTADKTKDGAGIQLPEAPRPVQNTQSLHSPGPNHPLGPSVAASEPDVPAVAQPAPEPTQQVLQSVAEAPKPVTEPPKPVPEPSKLAEEAVKPATQEPQVGEKRDLDSMATQAPVQAKPPAPESAAEKVNEPESKKQKTEQEPAKDTNGTTSAVPAAPAQPSVATAPAAETHEEEPKKAGRSKTEKIKDAVKKVLPTDGPGSRTRSRTKDS